MTAGSISAPVIVPLKIPLGTKRHESKHIVDQSTPIAITSGKQFVQFLIMRTPVFK